MVSTTNASLLPSSPRASTHVETNVSQRQTCSLLIPTESIQCILGCAGLVLNSIAMALLIRSQDLNKPFRILLSSLTSTDLILSSSCFLTGSLAFYTTFYGHTQGETTALSTVCNILTGLYHSLLGCGATTTLSLSIDRVVAVFAPVQYRAISLSGQTGKRATITLLPWMFALVCVVALPLTWRFHSDRHDVELAGLSCWPLVAVKAEFLFLQGAVLLLSVTGVMVAHLKILHKLTRRAILVVPIFGRRTAETTATERAQTRRSVAHATSQACNFLLLYLSLSVYLLWMATWDRDRRLEACEARYLLLSQFPAFNSIINPLLTLRRFRKCPMWCCLRFSDTPTDSQVQLPESNTNATESMDQGVKTISSTLKIHTEMTEPEKVASQPTVGEGGGEERKRHRTSGESYPSCSSRRDSKKHALIPGAHHKVSDQSERSDSSTIWFPPQDEYYSDRANPELLRHENTKDRHNDVQGLAASPAVTKDTTRTVSKKHLH